MEKTDKEIPDKNIELIDSLIELSINGKYIVNEIEFNKNTNHRKLSGIFKPQTETARSKLRSIESVRAVKFF